jgi:hypothetical protein
VVYANVQRDGDHSYHVFASHTQADDHWLGEHGVERVAQMAKVASFIEGCVGPPPFATEVFFLGDLNINGGQENIDVTPDTQEWHDRFVAPTPVARPFRRADAARFAYAGCMEPGAMSRRA